MGSNKKASRRNFIRQSSLGLGVGIMGVSSSFIGPNDIQRNETKKLPGEIGVATIDLNGLRTDSTRELRLRSVLKRMEELSGLQPDIMCLPELFDTIWVQEKLTVQEVAEEENGSGLVTARIAEFAKKHSCYVVCPLYTKSDGRFYNSSLLIDRKGIIAGVYHKIHPAKTEMLVNGTFGKGVSPGKLNQPVIQTDFGKVGMQIGYDAFWSDGWDNLKEQGANIILFSSDFPGGKMLNHYALRNNCYIISSTTSDARIIDISGKDLHSSSTFIRYGWANINLEKEKISAWPTNEILGDIFNKYGNRLEIKVWDDTGVVTVETHDADLRVSDVLKEFKIPTLEELNQDTEVVQKKYRL